MRDMEESKDTVYGIKATPSAPTVWAAFLVATILSLAFLGCWAIWLLLT